MKVSQCSSCHTSRPGSYIDMHRNPVRNNSKIQEYSMCSFYLLCPAMVPLLEHPESSLKTRVLLGCASYLYWGSLEAGNLGCLSVFLSKEFNTCIMCPNEALKNVQPVVLGHSKLQVAVSTGYVHYLLLYLSPRKTFPPQSNQNWPSVEMLSSSESSI